MKLQRVSQDAYLVQLLPIDGYVLQVNAEYARRKFPERGNVVHLLPDLMRRIVIESEVRAGDLLEHAPPDRGTGRKILPSGPFVGRKNHGAVLDGDPNPLVFRIG